MTTPERDMSKAVVTEERPIATPIARTTEATWRQVIQLFQKFGMAEPPWELRDELVTAFEWAWYGQSLDAALSHGAEAVEPEQKPVAWYREGFLVNFSLGEARPWGATSDPNEWKPLYASPVRSAQEAVSDLDIQIAYEAWIDRTIGARAPITAFYAGYRAALLPPGGETATPDSGRTE